MNKNSILGGLCSIGLVAIFCIAPHLLYYRGNLSGSLDEQMITFLQKYIRIDTSHPNPAYNKALNFLKKEASNDGFLYQEILLPSGNKVLVITYPGKNPSLPALALNHHIDVVPATNDGWVVPPFSGKIHNNEVVGRGAQDMKGIAAVHYFALKELKDLGMSLQRTVHIFAVPEEEVGGFKGTKEFIQTDQFKQLNVGFVLDEGHASGNSEIIDIKIAERKPVQIKITSNGELAHGSHLECKNAIHELVEFLHTIVGIHSAQKKQVETYQPGELLSCNITSLSAGIKKENGHIALNMVPNTAEATIDIRVPPTMKKQELISIIDELSDRYPNSSYQILAQADEEPELNDHQTDFYHTLAQAIETTGLQALPHFFEASSDLRYYQAQGIQGLGITPFAIQDNIHGINESVPICQLIKGKEIITRFIKEFCKG